MSVFLWGIALTSGALFLLYCRKKNYVPYDGQCDNVGYLNDPIFFNLFMSTVALGGLSIITSIGGVIMNQPHIWIAALIIGSICLFAFNWKKENYRLDDVFFEEPAALFAFWGDRVNWVCFGMLVAAFFLLLL